MFRSQCTSTFCSTSTPSTNPNDTYQCGSPSVWTKIDYIHFPLSDPSYQRCCSVQLAGISEEDYDTQGSPHDQSFTHTGHSDMRGSFGYVTVLLSLLRTSVQLTRPQTE